MDDTRLELAAEDLLSGGSCTQAAYAGDFGPHRLCQSFGQS